LVTLAALAMLMVANAARQRIVLFIQAGLLVLRVSAGRFEATRARFFSDRLWSDHIGSRLAA